MYSIKLKPLLQIQLSISYVVRLASCCSVLVEIVMLCDLPTNPSTYLSICDFNLYFHIHMEASVLPFIT